ncbi:outer membrane beta-barrel protein [Spectribacter hydrogenooxidans]|uniref:Outer membrane beta-barrel protein n=1 Tax=Spectribacter hydrogenoxidans TaxID=3075608 RepID=A0ABU3BYS6_9GAMM|nr:outer membrane beta-barrel protein [Salinisphaera sp. W335]MDT0634420.1 outer membrane beta-barrel protein [Salinisphaera sp. W335]
MKTSATLLTTALLASPLTALAVQSNYTYVEGDFVAHGEAETRFGGFRSEEDYDGYGFKGSIDITPNLFIESSYDELDADNNGGELELFSGGLGLRAPIGDNANPLDIYGVATYESLEENDGSGIEADGFGVTGGLRWQATPTLEINPYASYLDYGEIDNSNADLDGMRFGVDGVLNVNETFALTAGYRTTKLDIEGPGGDASLDLENEIRLGGRIYLTK